MKEVILTLDDKDKLNDEGQPQDPMMELPEIPVIEAQNENPGVSEEPPAAPPKHSRSGWKLFAAGVALVAVGGGIGSATTWWLARRYLDSRLPIGVASQSAGVPVSQTVPEGSSVIPQVYRQVSPSVVQIETQTQRGLQQGTGTGSGFVVDANGYILTNNHVIDGASSITVKFVDGTALQGQVVGKDKFKDLALVKVNPDGRQLVAVTLGDSDKVQVGELAIAIGSPFGQEFSVTAGIVSAVNRSIQEDSSWTISGAIQTDAAINPGNSGGPLLNDRGEVIGINTMIETGTSGVRGNVGIGFAVPINAAKEIIPTLMEGKQTEYPWLGIVMTDLTADYAQQLDISAKEGVIVMDVVAGSPAETAGLKAAAVTRRQQVVSADVVTAIDGQAVKTSDELSKLIAGKKVGDTVQLTVVRGKETLTLSAKLGSRPEQVPNQ